MSKSKRTVQTSELTPDDRLRRAVDVMIETAMEIVRGENANDNCGKDASCDN